MTAGIELEGQAKQYAMAGLWPQVSEPRRPEPTPPSARPGVEAAHASAALAEQRNSSMLCEALLAYFRHDRS
jgi:hypothetical protein